MINLLHQPNHIMSTGLDSYFMSKYRLSAYSHDLNNINVHVMTPNQFLKDITNLPIGPIAFNDALYNAYNSREKNFKLTRQLIIHAHAHCSKHAVVIIANNQDMLRDIDVFEALTSRRRLLIIMPMSHLNGDAKKILNTMYSLKSKGLKVGAITPDLYKLQSEDVPYMLKNIHSAGADFIIPTKMTLAKNRTYIYTALKKLGIPPRVPMVFWHDWFNLSDKLFLTTSHLQILLAENTLRYNKLGNFKRAYTHIMRKHHNDTITTAWLKSNSADSYVYDVSVKDYLKPLISNHIYDYQKLSWLPLLDDTE